MKNISRYKDNIRRKILIVEDEMINRQLLGFIVSKEYDVVYAENGMEALKILRTNNHGISLVLLDLLMPIMSGFVVLERIKDDPNLKRIPVIVLTSEKYAEVKSLQMGAQDFIPKPYDMPDVILARIKRAIELFEDTNLIRNTERDSLTGLFTKRYFFEYIRQYEEYQGAIPMDAVVLNIRRFHMINEIHGHAYGDYLLSHVAKALKSLLNDYEGIVCRTDSDTFYLFFEHQEEIEKTLNDNVLTTINKEFVGINVGLRVGIYQNVTSRMDIEDIFDRALHACNGLRNNYKDVYAYYDESMHNKEIYDERLLAQFDDALDKGQFMVYYQPKYNIKGDEPRLTSAEALVRWNHPEYGLISPGVFIPLLEDNGLIQKLDRFVWNGAAEQAHIWNVKYNFQLPISVNVSRVDIYDQQLESTLLDIVHLHHIEPKQLLLEITESAYTNDAKGIINSIKHLRADGFKIEMDDFGTGYSSLNMVSNLPIDVLKIDREFIIHMCTSDKDKKMVEILLNISDLLGVSVVAEGVETKEQFDMLKKMGCDIIQGFYFSKPLPADQFAKLIEEEVKNSGHNW